MTTVQLQALIRRYNRLIYKAHKKSIKAELSGWPQTAARHLAATAPLKSRLRELEDQLAAKIKDAHA